MEGVPEWLLRDHDMSAGDATDKLYKSCYDDELPNDSDCLKAFMFDRCLYWPALLGLYAGITNIVSDLMQTYYKERLREAARQGSVAECVSEIYTSFHQKAGKAYGGHYWPWFKANRYFFDYEKQSLRKGSKVSLHGLVSSAALNSATGSVVGDVTDNEERIPVKLLGPPEVVASHPSGVRVRACNLKLLLQKVVIVWGTIFFETELRADLVGPVASHPQMALAGVKPKPVWMPCPIAAKLGLPPLLLLQLAPGLSPRNEHGREDVKGNRFSAFLYNEAPPEVRESVLGPIMMARVDNGDLQLEEVRKLERFIVHLVKRWTENPSTDVRQDLTRGSYEAFA